MGGRTSNILQGSRHVSEERRLPGSGGRPVSSYFSPAQEPFSPVPTAQGFAFGLESSICRCSDLPYRRVDDIPETMHRGHPTWHLFPRTGRFVVGYGFDPGWFIEHSGFSAHSLGGPRKPLPVPRLTAGGCVAGPAAAHDGAGAVGCGADEERGRLHQQAGPGHGQAGLFWGSHSVSRTAKLSSSICYSGSRAEYPACMAPVMMVPGCPLFGIIPTTLSLLATMPACPVARCQANRGDCHDRCSANACRV